MPGLNDYLSRVFSESAVVFFVNHRYIGRLISALPGYLQNNHTRCGEKTPTIIIPFRATQPFTISPGHVKSDVLGNITLSKS